MSYFGGINRRENYKHNGYDNNFGDTEHNMNTSYSNLKEFDKSMTNENEYDGTSGGVNNIGGYGEDENGGEGEGGEPNAGLIEKKEFKELEIYDPL